MQRNVDGGTATPSVDWASAQRSFGCQSNAERNAVLISKYRIVSLITPFWEIQYVLVVTLCIVATGLQR